jgi:glucokinase
VSIITADIGGTHIRVGLVTPDGEMIARHSIRTRSERGANAGIGDLVRMIDVLLSQSSDPLIGIGIAVTGPVDRDSGIVDNPYTLPGWGPTDLVSPLQERFQTPVLVENDANAAALGEWWRGAGQGSRRLAAVTIGTGIGVGLLIDGDVQRRPDGAHGEAGHHILDPNGPVCYCGARGCWEVLASGAALVRLAREAGYATSTATPAPEAASNIADRVIKSASAGDPSATRILEQIASCIGLGLVNTVAFFMPDTIVLGGGIGSRCFTLLQPTIDAVLAQHRHLVPTNVSVRRAATGDDAGLIGAALGLTAPGPTT